MRADSGEPVRPAFQPVAVVCIPARDEAAELPGLLEALYDQDVPNGTFALCLLLDGGDPDSATFLRERLTASDIPYLIAATPPAPPSAGRARGAACRQGLFHFPSAKTLLTTDADTRPAPDWVRRTLAALEAADLVAGRIERACAESWPARSRQEAFLERLHTFRRRIDQIPHDPLPSHPSLGGASLGMRRATYEHIGGFSSLLSGEDRALVHAARCQGWRVRHDPAVRVTTSDRRSGRAPGGLAAELAKLAANPLALRVPDPDAALRLYHFQAWLRGKFEVPSETFSNPPPGFGKWSDPGRLSDIRTVSPTADAFVVLAGPPDDVVPLTELARAERRLRLLEARIDRAVAA